jgi:hypothetical protein
MYYSVNREINKKEGKEGKLRKREKERKQFREEVESLRVNQCSRN